MDSLLWWLIAKEENAKCYKYLMHLTDLHSYPVNNSDYLWQFCCLSFDILCLRLFIISLHFKNRIIAGKKLVIIFLILPSNWLLWLLLFAHGTFIFLVNFKQKHIFNLKTKWLLQNERKLFHIFRRRISTRNTSQQSITYTFQIS